MLCTLIFLLPVLAFSDDFIIFYIGFRLRVLLYVYNVYTIIVYYAIKGSMNTYI